MVNYYVKIGGDDTKDGLSWANAWATINKAATTVADGSTVYIGFGDYNSEPVNNKIAPQNLGGTGIKYNPVTEGLSSGVGSVYVKSVSLTGGSECINRSAAGALTRTVIQPSNPINGNGTLTNWCFYAYNSGGTAKLKIFRDDGTNYNFIGESSLVSMNSGINTNSCSIAVQTGDLVGIYVNGAYCTVANLDGNSAPYRVDDVSSNTLKSSWNTTVYETWSVRGYAI